MSFSSYVLTVLYEAPVVTRSHILNLELFDIHLTRSRTAILACLDARHFTRIHKDNLHCTFARTVLDRIFRGGGGYRVVDVLDFLHLVVLGISEITFFFLLVERKGE